MPQEELCTLNEGATRLPSHPDRLKTPGVDATTGSLGQGISVAAGLALDFEPAGQNASDESRLLALRVRFAACGDCSTAVALWLRRGGDANAQEHHRQLRYVHPD